MGVGGSLLARARARARTHTCMHAHMHACTHARMHTCTHAHMHICAHAHMQMHTRVQARTRTRANIHHMHTHHACLHAHIHAVRTRKRSKRSVQSQASTFQVLLQAGREQEVVGVVGVERELRTRVNESQREPMLRASLPGTGQPCLFSSS